MSKAGLSILLRAGNNKQAAQLFLQQLLKVNTLKALEVVIIFNEPQEKHLQLVRDFSGKLSVVVRIAKGSTFNRLESQLRYDTVMIASTPIELHSDVLSKAIYQFGKNNYFSQSLKNSGLKGTLLLRRDQMHRITEFFLNTPLTTLKQRLVGDVNNDDLNRTASTTEMSSKKSTEIQSYAEDDQDSIKLKKQQVQSSIEYERKLHINYLLWLQNREIPELSEDFKKKYGWLEVKKYNKEACILANHDYDYSNKLVHRCNVFKEFEPLRGKRECGLRIILLSSFYLKECLEYDADIVCFELEKCFEQLQEYPHFVLIESCSLLLKVENSPIFLEFLSQCKERGVPIVFWHTEAYENCSLYQDISSKLNYIAAVEESSVLFYKKVTSADVVLLEHAIQPALHNSLKKNRKKYNYSNLNIFFDAWADVIEYRDRYKYLLEPLSTLGLHIFESRWEFMKNKLPEVESFARNIQGCISYKQRLEAIKEFDFYLSASMSLKSSSTRVKEALEAVASKSLLLVYGDNDLDMLENISIHSSDCEKLIDNIALFKKYPAYKEEKIHKAWREVHLKHTYMHRLSTISDWLSLSVSCKSIQSVSSVTITKRPEMLVENAKDNYLRQSLKNKEWIVVLNTPEVDFLDVKEKLEIFPNVKVFQVSSDKNIGYCLNMAIRKSSSMFWAKMDDDDIYGESYLLDYMLNYNCCSFEVIGKRPSFTYLENEDSIYTRMTPSSNHHMRDFISFDYIPHICGATFCGKKELIDNIEFSEYIRSAVDSSWYQRCISEKVPVVFSDNYNMTIFRASDKTKHTWRLDDDGLKKNALFVSKGVFSSLINV